MWHNGDKKVHFWRDEGPNKNHSTRKSRLPATAKLSPGMGTGQDADESMNKSS